MSDDTQEMGSPLFTERVLGVRLLADWGVYGCKSATNLMPSVQWPESGRAVLHKMRGSWLRLIEESDLSLSCLGMPYEVIA